ncbi:MAG: hypothetical protein ABI072_00770, partial [Edaphobacter sp.]
MLFTLCYSGVTDGPSWGANSVGCAQHRVACEQHFQPLEHRLRTLLRGAATFVVGLTVAALPLAAQTVEFSGNGTVHRAVDNMQAGDVFSFQYFLPQSPTLDPGDVFPQHFTLTSVTGT